MSKHNSPKQMRVANDRDFLSQCLKSFGPDGQKTKYFLALNAATLTRRMRRRQNAELELELRTTCIKVLMVWLLNYKLDHKLDPS